MSLRKTASIWALAIGFMTGCPTPQQEGTADYRLQEKRTVNGMGVNGQGVNGQGINGQGVNGQGINGMGVNGQGVNGMGVNGQGVNGTGIEGLTLIGAIYNGSGINGGGVNGGGVNGGGVNGGGVNGGGVNGGGVNGGGVNGQAVTGLNLNGSQLVISINGQQLTGKDVVGLELRYSYQQAGSQTSFQFTIRIDSASLDPTAHMPAGQANDIWMYNLLWRQDAITPTPAWQSLCFTELNVPDQALMLANRWDLVTGNRLDQASFITFACRDYALGKCARMGYRPWAKGTTCSGSGSQRKCTDIALTDHHQSCVRMMRADYCGTGKSYTVNGTLIDIYDYLNPPIQVPETNWDIEARWTPTGAICINEPRHPELVGKWKRPDCNGDGKPDNFPACGQSDNRYSGKGLVVDRFDDDQSGCGK